MSERSLFDVPGRITDEWKAYLATLPTIEEPPMQDKVRAAIVDVFYAARDGGSTTLEALDIAAAAAWKLVGPHVEALEHHCPAAAEALDPGQPNS